MFFFLSKTLDLACAPISWAIALIGTALLLVLRRSSRRRLAAGCLGSALLVLLVCGNRMVANRAWWALEGAAPRTYRDDVTYDAVVLLGGVIPTGAREPGAPESYNDNVERLLATFDLLRRDRAKVAIVSGGSARAGEGALLEADALAAQLVEWGIAPERIVVENSSLNTRQNALETATILRSRGDERVLLVTSAFHMARALGCFRAADLHPDALPVDFRAREPASMGWELAPRSDALDRFTEAVRERAGQVVYSAVGYSR